MQAGVRLCSKVRGVSDQGLVPVIVIMGYKVLSGLRQEGVIVVNDRLYYCGYELEVIVTHRMSDNERVDVYGVPGEKKEKRVSLKALADSNDSLTEEDRALLFRRELERCTKDPYYFYLQYWTLADGTRPEERDKDKEYFDAYYESLKDRLSIRKRTYLPKF